MADILFVSNVCFEVLSASFENECFDLVVAVGVDECSEVFSIGLGVEEGAEGGGGANVGRVVTGYVDCSCLCCRYAR